MVPLALGPGIVGATAADSSDGAPDRGLHRLEGKFAVGVGEVNPLWQLIGVVTTVAVVGIPALVMCLVFERSGGLRISEEAELGRARPHQWGGSNYADDDVAACRDRQRLPRSR